MNIITELTSPNICIICRRPCIQIDRYPGFCSSCLQTLPWRAERSLIEVEHLTAGLPVFHRQAQDPVVYAACDYEGRLRRCLIELKFYGRTGMARPLASILAQTIINQGLIIDAVAAVPLFKTRLIERGYNQAGLLAVYTSKMIDCLDISDLLVRVKNTGRQSEQVNRRARFQNLEGAFCLDLNRCRSVGRILEKRRILLIDDVLTTGA